MADAEILARVERRRKWTAEEKAALIAEVEAEGGKVAVVARRHGVSESLLYNWRAAWKAAAALARTPEPVEFVPLGVFGRAGEEGPVMLAAPANGAAAGPSGDQGFGMISLAPGTVTDLASAALTADLRRLG